MSQEQKNMIAYLQSWTSYSFSYLSNLSSRQLYAIYSKTNQERFQLIEEINDLQLRLPEVKYVYPKRELKAKKNEELRNIRTLLYDPLKEENSFNDNGILLPTTQDEGKQQVSDNEYLTSSELEEMFGELAMEYSLAELQKRGVYSLDFSPQRAEREDALKDELKDELITLFMEAHKRRITYFPFSKQAAKKYYTLHSLKLMYSKRLLNKQGENFPSKEEISARLSLSPF